MRRIKINRELRRVRKNFLVEVSWIVAGKTVESFYHPLILAIAAGTPRQHRAELRIKKARNFIGGECIGVKDGDFEVYYPEEG